MEQVLTKVMDVLVAQGPMALLLGAAIYVLWRRASTKEDAYTKFLEDLIRDQRRDND